MLNESEFGNTICGNYRFSTSFRNTFPGYMGCDIRAISIENSKDVKLDSKISTINIVSVNGRAIGLDI